MLELISSAATPTLEYPPVPLLVIGIPANFCKHFGIPADPGCCRSLLQTPQLLVLRQ